MCSSSQMLSLSSANSKIPARRISTRWKLPCLTSQRRQTCSGFQHTAGSQEMNELTSLIGMEASWTKRTDTPLTPMKRPSSKPSPPSPTSPPPPPPSKKNGSSNTQTLTSQTTPTNWTDWSRLFCSSGELGTTDLMPTCTTHSRLVSLRCAHAMKTSWLQNIYCCSTANYMMLWGRTWGQNRCHWGTNSLAIWRSWGGQPLS